MLPLDSCVQKRVGNQQRRSETELRLYWSTFERMSRHVAVPLWRSYVGMKVRRLITSLLNGWLKRDQSNRQANVEKAHVSP